MSSIKLLTASLIIGLMMTAAGAESYLYLEQTKQINGSYAYRLPKLELNQAKWAGKFFNQPCWYLSEFEGGLVYSAPRSSPFSLNHHSVEGEWSFGVQSGPFWATYSIGVRYFIEGNSDGIPAGVEGFNTARLGIAIP
jgi:hypothetical protein